MLTVQVVRGRLAYDITHGLTAGINVSYDEAFDTRASADVKVRFGGASTSGLGKEVQQLHVINALKSTPSDRDTRIHNRTRSYILYWYYDLGCIPDC